MPPDYERRAEPEPPVTMMLSHFFWVKRFIWIFPHFKITERGTGKSRAGIKQNF